MERRAFLEAGGLLFAGFIFGPRLWAATTHDVRLIEDRATGAVVFDPVGLYIAPGDTVRWVNDSGVHTVTAYHPVNGNRALRIPRQAEPWDSGYLVEPDAVFERTFSVPGIYDYFCRPHERAGMAGRLVVGEISGPGAQPFGVHTGDAGGNRQAVPQAVQDRLPDPAAIREQTRVRGL